MTPTLVPATAFTYYDYKGVRFKVGFQKDDTPDQWKISRSRTVRAWGYIHLWFTNTNFTRDTTMVELLTALGSETQCEHVRKEISIAFDDDRGEEWRKPSVHFLCGWDYQHSWNDYDPSPEMVMCDCMNEIDRLIESGVIKYEPQPQETTT